MGDFTVFRKENTGTMIIGTEDKNKIKRYYNIL